MSRMTPLQGLLLNLEGKISLQREREYLRLLGKWLSWDTTANSERNEFASHTRPFVGFSIRCSVCGSNPDFLRELYLPKEEARKRLVALTGQDSGYDVRAWRAWLRKEGKR